VVFGTAPATGIIVLVWRQLALTQSALDLSPNGAFTADGVEGAIDWLTLQVQQVNEKVGRALRFRRTSAEVDPYLEDLTDHASEVVAINAGETGLESTGVTMDEFTTDVAAAAASAAAAAASESAAATSASSAATSATAAASSATSAAASAAAAAASLTATTPTISGSRASPTNVTSAGITAVTSVYFQSWYIKGSPGAVDLTAVNPNISAGNLVGARIKLTGCDGTNTVTIFGNDTNKMITNGVRVLGDGSVWEGEWNGTAWQESSFNDL
jgi:hypothetical protein